MVTDRHLVIGLTGNLGAGKSTVGRIAGDLGARVIDSDQTVRDLLTKDSELASSIQGAFGTEVMLDGRPDRAALARIVFEDPGELARLEKILYPRVGERTAELIAEPTSAPATVIEAIKIVEGPNVDRLHALWLVVAPPDVQIKRATATGRISAAEARRRLAVQSSPDDKERLFRARRPGRPVWRIHNSTDLQALQRRVAAVWRETLAYGDGPTP
ncbi:MAG: dephospho-CoA kinase [Chloroflexota bacterium]|nr:dephospho-CoA kinase [Chloroflexota bacterium]MDE2920166.1 dephospho-CoA kinase [Chloroflexota bacterium]